MAGILLDTHVLYWLVSGEEPLSDDALVAIGQNQLSGSLYVSPITAWELSLAVLKPTKAPRIGDMTASRWFRAAVRETAAKVIPIGLRIALEAANVVSTTGHRDPGDCYLIATARVRNMPLVTREATLNRLSAPDYLDVIRC